MMWIDVRRCARIRKAVRGWVRGRMLTGTPWDEPPGRAQTRVWALALADLLYALRLSVARRRFGPRTCLLAAPHGGLAHNSGFSQVTGEEKPPFCDKALGG